MSGTRYDIAIVGGGIIGLSTALQLRRKHPGCRVVVLEKEDKLAVHQSGHNSGVIHSGIYYRPGSQKARLCLSGKKSLTRFCLRHDIEFERCGKVIVATDQSELGRLEGLYARGVANGVTGLELIGPERLKEIEPNASGVAALHAPGTGIVDFKLVANRYAEVVRATGGEILTGTEVRSIDNSGGTLFLETKGERVEATNLINCAGLYSDKLARMMGLRIDLRIIPFRGEYFTLRPQSAQLVKGLIYPVPNPKLPFLGVHFTRNIHGIVEAGPNAVLAFAREGYRGSDLKVAELLSTLSFVGFWRMAGKFWKAGIFELHRSLIKKVFLGDLQRLLPDISDADLVPGKSGVRAQAVDRTGRLLDDFSIRMSKNSIHVLNAPSPAATSSLAIGRHIVELASQTFNL